MTVSSVVISVPGPSLKLDNTRRGTAYLLASSTARECSTLEPELASSSISSNVTCASLEAPVTTRGSVV